MKNQSNLLLILNSKTMEQTTVIGNLGRDAESKVHNGNQFVSFTIAASKKYTKANGEKVERTTWYNCVTRQMNLAQYLRKGTQVLVQGEPNNKAFRNNNGEWLVSNNINCDMIQLLGSPKENGSSGSQQTTQAASQSTQVSRQPVQTPEPSFASTGDDKDDLPF